MGAPWRKYRCGTCGEVYDEALGDSEAGIPPFTRFEALPDDWICPACGMGKAGFERLD